MSILWQYAWHSRMSCHWGSSTWGELCVSLHLSRSSVPFLCLLVLAWTQFWKALVLYKVHNIKPCKSNISIIELMLSEIIFKAMDIMDSAVEDVKISQTKSFVELSFPFSVKAVWWQMRVDTIYTETSVFKWEDVSHRLTEHNILKYFIQNIFQRNIKYFLCCRDVSMICIPKM